MKQYARANEITVDEARKRLETRSAKFAEGHAHRFRDTFAVERVGRSSGHRYGEVAANSPPVVQRSVKRCLSAIRPRKSGGVRLPPKQARVADHPATLARCAVALSGTRAEIVVPWLGSDLIESSPPTNCILSRMLMSPRPR